MRVKLIIEFPIYNETCVSIRARMVKWFHPDWAANSASWWSAAWRAWPAPEAPRALVLSKIRATVTQRKRKKVKAKHVLLPFNPRTPLSSPLVPPAVPLLLPLLLSPLLHPFCPGMKAPIRLFSSCSAVQSVQQERLSPHWVWGGVCLFPLLTPTIAQLSALSSARQPCCF